MVRRAFGALLGILVVSVSIAEDQLKVGMNAPTSNIAEFVTGSWAERGSSCPVLVHREATKIAIFVRQLNDPVLPLVRAMDALVADDAALKWSFVFVSHENAPTPSQEEWDAQLIALRKLASEKKVEHLSMGVMLRLPDDAKNTRAKRKLGFFGDGDVVVMLIRPDATAKRGLIQYVSVLKSEEITNKTIESLSSQLKDALAAAK